MPQVTALRALRYNLAQTGALADVVAPPYDVIDGQMQQRLYDRSPYNVVRLILNKDEDGDDELNNRYTRAAAFLKQWMQEGALIREADPAMYLYQQQFELDGQARTRRGFLCGVRLERFGEGQIYPHEETHPGPKADRLKLTNATGTQLSPVFGIYPDEENSVQDTLEQVVRGAPPLEVTADDGVIHRLWPVTDIEAIGRVSALLSGKPTFVADGHHRYETACAYRDMLAEGGAINLDHPANFILMTLISMSDSGMLVLPTHRLFRGAPPMTREQLIERLGDAFTCEAAGDGPGFAPDIWSKIEKENEQGTLALFTGADKKWTRICITDAGVTQMADLAADHSEDWRGLGVSILQRLVVESRLGLTDLPKPLYSRDMKELVERLTRGDLGGRDATGQAGQAGDPFHLAALVMPATLEHVRAISEHGERMPAKSTFFYPKLLSGLVFHPVSP